jgi:hypothetical protein
VVRTSLPNDGRKQKISIMTSFHVSRAPKAKRGAACKCVWYHMRRFPANPPLASFTKSPCEVLKRNQIGSRVACT